MAKLTIDPQVRKLVHHCRQNPLFFGKMLWPEVTFYREQRQIINSVRDNDETFVVAGNMLGF